MERELPTELGTVITWRFEYDSTLHFSSAVLSWSEEDDEPVWYVSGFDGWRSAQELKKTLDGLGVRWTQLN